MWFSGTLLRHWRSPFTHGWLRWTGWYTTWTTSSHACRASTRKFAARFSCRAWNTSLPRRKCLPNTIRCLATKGCSECNWLTGFKGRSCFRRASFQINTTSLQKHQGVKFCGLYCILIIFNFQLNTKCTFLLLNVVFWK